MVGALVKGEPPTIPKKVYEEAMKVHRPALIKAYADYFAQQKVAAIAFPTVPLPAAPIGDDQETLLDGKKTPTFVTFIRITDPGGNAGVPRLSLPMGTTKSELPVGIALDGPRGSDRKLLAIGLALEALFGPIPAPKQAKNTRPWLARFSAECLISGRPDIRLDAGQINGNSLKAFSQSIACCIAFW